jgi:hypothetical protein
LKRKESNVAVIRIVLADLPALIEDILAAVLDVDPELRRVRDLEADVAILGAEPAALVERGAPMLIGRPKLVVLGIDPTSGAASSLGVRPHGTPGPGELRTLLHALGTGR